MLLANLSSISEYSSLPAESRMKSSWNQKDRFQESLHMGKPVCKSPLGLPAHLQGDTRTHTCTHICLLSKARGRRWEEQQRFPTPSGSFWAASHPS